MSELITLKKQLPPKKQNQELKEATVSKAFRANKFTMINGSLIPSSKLYGLCSMPNVRTDSEEMLKGKTFSHLNKQRRKHIVFFLCGCLGFFFLMLRFFHAFIFSSLISLNFSCFPFQLSFYNLKEQFSILGNCSFSLFQTLR